MKQQLASFLTEHALEGIKKLDKNSLAAKDLSKIDVDVVLKEDVQQFCEVVTFPEIVKIMALGTAFKLGGDTARVKDDLKKIGKNLLDRVEKKQVKLKTPMSCRDMLFNL
ncbi:MAG: hypothetical protein HQL26_10565 [Candidatus Omnitrophica bacterium]|nr:hypothetical protein [Candidatus Omnitrophota bacterium]